jgi:hypothetical protein
VGWLASFLGFQVCVVAECQANKTTGGSVDSGGRDFKNGMGLLHLPRCVFWISWRTHVLPVLQTTLTRMIEARSLAFTNGWGRVPLRLFQSSVSATCMCLVLTDIVSICVRVRLDTCVGPAGPFVVGRGAQFWIILSGFATDDRM